MERCLLLPKRFALMKYDVTFPNLDVAISDTFDFPTHQRNSSFKFFLKEIVVTRFRFEAIEEGDVFFPFVCLPGI